jgi:hypothetical protein
LEDVKYNDWLEAFKEDYCIGSTPHDCDTAFDYFGQQPDSDDIRVDVEATEGGAAGDEATEAAGIADGGTTLNDQGEIIEMGNEDFMYFVDVALSEIVSALPSAHPKTALCDHLLPYMQVLDDEDDSGSSSTCMYLHMSQFTAALENLGVSLSKQCLYALG